MPEYTIQEEQQLNNIINKMHEGLAVLEIAQRCLAQLEASEAIHEHANPHEKILLHTVADRLSALTGDLTASVSQLAVLAKLWSTAYDA